MIVVNPSKSQFLSSNVHRLTRCWEITRADSVVLRFTSHDTILTLDDGNSYTPVDGVSGTAFEKKSRLQGEANIDYSGIISSSAITDDDLRSGRYRNAKIITKIVDWMHPWLGPLVSTTVYALDVNFNGEFWDVKTGGVSSLLRGTVGKTHTVTCPFTLGDSNCKFSLVAESETVSTIVAARRKFTVSGLAGTQSNDFYKYGKVTWTSGNNAGLISEIKSYVNASGTIELRLQTASEIAIGDGFDITEGCDKTRDTCTNKFSNVVNFGGFPFIPGTDRIQAGVRTSDDN